MNNWYKGNKPSHNGLYWVTVNNDGEIKMYTDPLRYEDGVWRFFDPRWRGRTYDYDDIIAWAPCNMPKEPYNENHIGFPEQFYLRVKTGDGETMFLSKGFQSVKWTKVGYATREKAMAARRRYINTEGYKNSDVAVVNGNGEEV